MTFQDGPQLTILTRSRSSRNPNVGFGDITGQVCPLLAYM
jgi:hypothetical protein